jgi:hypothetical protein
MYVWPKHVGLTRSLWSPCVFQALFAACDSHVIPATWSLGVSSRRPLSLCMCLRTLLEMGSSMRGLYAMVLCGKISGSWAYVLLVQCVALQLVERVLHDMPRLSEMSSDTMLVCV